MSEPFGTPIPSVLPLSPAGYLPCDGSAIPAHFGELIAAVGLNTPDYRGAVLAGAGANGVVLNQRNAGTLPGIPAVAGNATTGIPTGNYLANARESTYAPGPSDTATAGGSEFVCTHVGVNWIIRARP